MEAQKVKNRNYNAERKRMNEMFIRDIDRDKFIEDIYSNSYKDIQSRIDKFYLSYADKEGLSLSQAKKKASKMDVVKFQKRAEQEVKKARELAERLGRNVTYDDFSQATNEWLRVYNLKMRISRLELLKAEISIDLNELYGNTFEFMEQELTKEAYEELERQAGILGNSAKATREQLQKITYADFHGKNFAERIWGKNGHYGDTQKEVFKSISRIFTTMEGYKAESERLQEKFNVSSSRSMTLLKTEVSRVNSQAREESYKANGFTHYRYVAEPSACDLCKPMDNQIFKIEEREIGVNAAPMHPNCKCRDYGIVEMFENGVSTVTGKRK